MKYIRPPDFKSVMEFEAHFKKIEQDITELLTTDGSARTANELNEKLSQALNAAVSYLSKVNRDFTEKELPKAFQEGKDRIKDPPKVSAKEAAEILEKQGFKYAKNSFSRDTYIEIQTATKSAGDGLKSRVNSIIKDLHKTGQDSVYNVQQAIAKDLAQHGIFTVTYSNGAKQSLHSYAAMAARSARIESVNIGEIGRALQSGTDLVKMTEMPQCCKLCSAYQGKVYSISGKDKRFPALFKTVLKNGYALPHPNCRHEFIPWHEEIEDPADVEKAIKDSRIKYDEKGDLVDVRHQRDIEGYAQWQAGNRQLNREYLEYKRMTDHYQEIGQEPPYKTLGSFRRARRADTLSPTFKAWRNRKRDQKQYEEWVKEIGKENMPGDIDKFVEIKYNRRKQQEYETIRIAVDDVRIRRSIGTSSFPLDVHKGKQGKHIIGHNNFKEGKSRLVVEDAKDGVKFAQYLVNKYARTGLIKRDKNGNWTSKEKIEAQEIVGYVNTDGENFVATKCFMIHYSKTGVHIVPILEEENENGRNRIKEFFR